MIPAIPRGYTATIAITASTPEELGNFEPLEQTLPEFTRVVVECPVDPSEDISSIAQSIEDACVSYGIPAWPEYPNTHTFVEGNMLYITYVKASPWIQFLVPILLLVAFLGPLILWIVSPAVREMTEMVVTIAILFGMVWLMRKMIPVAGPKAPKEIKEKLPPLEERISARLSSLGETIFRLESLYKTAPATAASQVTSSASGLISVAGAVRAAPETAMSGYEKAKATKRMSDLSRRLAEYEERLTPEQKVKLHREQEIVRELREMYP